MHQHLERTLWLYAQSFIAAGMIEHFDSSKNIVCSAILFVQGFRNSEAVNELRSSASSFVGQEMKELQSCAVIEVVGVCVHVKGKICVGGVFVCEVRSEVPECACTRLASGTCGYRQKQYDYTIMRVSDWSNAVKKLFSRFRRGWSVIHEAETVLALFVC